jgi:hypothetical protein
MTREILIHLPEAHEKQRAFIDSPAKRKVIVAGRRGGKTTGVAMLSSVRFPEGRRILYAAPTSEQTDAYWSRLKSFLREVLADGIVRKWEGDRILELPNGGRIKAKTAWNADTLRGDYADLLLMEEYSIMDPLAWEEVGAPMLLDNDGDAVFIFTPKRKNHAWQLYNRAIQDPSGRWACWHFTSFDNPFLSQAALAEITQDMTEENYKQEILAEFLEGEGAVFRNIRACTLAMPNDLPENHQGHSIVAGVDWGKQNDYTAISIGCAHCRRELALDRFNQIDYSFQSERLIVLFDKWHVRYSKAEQNSIGMPIIEQLQRRGINVMGFETTATSKPPLIESLALELERGTVQWLDLPFATSELETYERKVNPHTGRAQYSAPEGLHDDTVIARALMLSAMLETTPRTRKPQPNPWLPIRNI